MFTFSPDILENMRKTGDVHENLPRSPPIVGLQSPDLLLSMFVILRVVLVFCSVSLPCCAAKARPQIGHRHLHRDVSSRFGKAPRAADGAKHCRRRTKRLCSRLGSSWTRTLPPWELARREHQSCPCCHLEQLSVSDSRSR